MDCFNWNEMFKCFFFNQRNCKYCFDGIVFLLSELIVNRVLIVSIVINKICSLLFIIIIITSSSSISISIITSDT